MTIREKLERGEIISEEEWSLFFENKYTIHPCCCFDTKLRRGQALYSCSWLDYFIPADEFYLKCLVCQDEISNYYGEKI